MSDAPPQLGDIPQHSEMNIPTLSTTTGGGSTFEQPTTTNGSATLQNAKDTVYTSKVSYYLSYLALKMLTRLGCSLPHLLA
jgi:hypothetical protein